MRHPRTKLGADFDGKLQNMGTHTLLKPRLDPGAVVLAHGLIGWGARSASKLCGALYFNGIADHLRSKHGLRVLAPDVDGIAPSSQRGAQLLEQIRDWPERREGERVAVIGHSQGGLDARWAISQLGGDELIARLVTLSTPHRGSALCEHIALPLLENSPPFLHGLLGSLCVPIEAAYFLSPAAMVEFNQTCPDSPEVVYLSLGGTRTRYEYWAPFIGLAPLLAYCDPGPNDGLVTVASARWGEYLGTLPFDHVDQLNFPMKVIHRAPMEPLWDYLAAVITSDATQASARCSVAMPQELLLHHRK